MTVKKIPPIAVTKKQREWIESEQNRTGNTFASIIRGLIQGQIDTKALLKNNA